jgi:tetratricopeptide (TPR) repeat protein
LVAINQKTRALNAIRLNIISLFAIVCLLPYVALFAAENSTIDSLNFQLETSKSDTSKVKILIALSKNYSNINTATSMIHAKDALELADKTGQNELIRLSLNNLGNESFTAGLFEEAIKHYYRYLEISKKLNDDAGIATALINIGAIKLQSRSFEEALSNFEKALEMRNLNQNKEIISDENLPLIYNNIGIAYENLGDLDQAITYYTKALNIATALKNMEGVTSMLYNNLGKTYTIQAMPEEALDALHKALAIRELSGNKWGQAASYRNLGSFYEGLKQYDEALTNLYKGLKLAEEIDNTPLLGQLSERMYTIYDSLTLPDSALKYHVLYMQHNDAIRMNEAMKELTRLELTSQFNEKEKQREEAIKRLHQQYFFLGITLLLLLVILGLFYYLSLSRLRRLKLEKENIKLLTSNLQLENENLEKELELKNKELTTNIMYQINKNELINEIAQRLLSHSSHFKKENQELIHSIINDLAKTQHEHVWGEFETRFHQVYENFYDRLYQINPDLSTNERRLCAFLRLNMTTKEIAAITNQSIRSIEVARTRLRRKLRLTNSETGLIEFLVSI